MTLSTCIYGCSAQHRKRLVRKALLVNVEHPRDSAQSLRWVIGDVKVSTRYGEVIAEARIGKPPPMGRKQLKSGSGSGLLIDLPDVR